MLKRHCNNGPIAAVRVKTVAPNLLFLLGSMSKNLGEPMRTIGMRLSVQQHGSKHFFAAAMLLGFALSPVSRTFADDAVAPGAAASLGLAAGSTLSIDGDSTLHKYSAKAQKMRATFQLSATAAQSKSDVGTLFQKNEIKSAELIVPVANLSSGESGLDDNLRKALDADKNPSILFHIESYEVRAASTAGGPFTLALHGKLEVAGVTHDLDVLASGVQTSTGFQLTGSKDLLMSDYKVKAPVLMLGMLKTKDLVTIQFDLRIERK